MLTPNSALLAPVVHKLGKHSQLDPDEIEADLSMGVLSLTVLNKHKVVINSHRAARQIWMSAQRKAWHFDPSPGAPTFTTANAELVTTVETVLSR